MAKNRFLDKKWQNSHLKKIKERAGNRYTPELNVDLPIADIFNGISRTENFYISIRKHFGKLNREFSHVSSKYENEEIQKTYQSLQREISQLSKLLHKLKEYNTNDIPWIKINQRAQKAEDVVWKLADKLREEQKKAEHQKVDDKQEGRPPASEKLSFSIHYLYEIQKELSYFEELSSSTKAELSNSPRLLLTGRSGTGKTHLLCDIVENRITGRQLLPAVLVFGELFVTNADPFAQIIKQLGLQLNKSQFLRLLNSAGEQSKCRAILAIDALNESRQRDFWKNNLNKTVKELKKYPNIALVISVRSGFEEEVLTGKQKEVFIHEEHQGFQFREWEAVSKFFREFNLPLPEIPLLTPEFQNPLFLLLFCKAFQRRGKKNNNKKQKQVFRGHEGATYIFEAFVDSVSKRISKQFGIGKGAGTNIWDTVIEKIAAEMVNQNDDRISEDQVVDIAKNGYPSIDHAHFIKELERNLLLVKIPRYSTAKREYEGFDFRFPFQKFSDHLIGRYLFKKYEKEFGKTNKNLETAKKFFSRRRKLGKFLSKSWNPGIVEALSIQCPEHLKGCELVEAAPYLRGSHIAREAFIESLIWRKPEAFSVDQKNTLDYINREIIRTESGHANLLNAFLAVAPIPNHPFNADFLHTHLSKFSMAKRDSWWSTFLHYQCGEKSAVDRLVEWGWSEQDKTYINDESIRLCSVALIWFLTTPNRFLRDRSTKALVALLTNRLSVVLNLLKRFQDVNDSYVSERLYAVAYGSAIRSRDGTGLKELSKWIYDNIFQNSNPPVDILLRDYARGIIEVALHEKVKLRISRRRIEPPFSSEWPNKAPSEKLLRKRYYPEDFFKKKTENRGFLDIWSSVMYNFGSVPADFGNYILNSAVGHWSGRKLNGKEINRRILFEKFKKELTKNQKKLLEKATNPFFGIDLPNLLKIRVIPRDKAESFDEEKAKRQEREQKEEMKQAYADFKKSLSAKKKRFFNQEIKPFLNDRGSISDPLEQFDTGFAQRWVFNRVVQLGWGQELHGQFDRYVNRDRVGRSEHKAERIGKKYQWIALHELLARISDRFEFKDEIWSYKVKKYEGTWQLSIRDIDPSCILKEAPNTRPDGLPKFSGHEKRSYYNSWSKKQPDSAWLKRTKDLPDPKHIIEFIDSQKNSWVALEGFIEWQEETQPEYEKYDLSTRTLWYMIKSYLVKEQDGVEVVQWAKRQHFVGGWMPESHEFYNIYLGEYPWAPAFLYHFVPYYHHDGWVDNARGKQIPAKLLVTDDKYLSCGSSIDCSTNESIRVKLPAKFIADEMNLVQQYIDGIFFDKEGDLVALDPNVFDIDMPKCTLIRKDKLCDFLKRKRCAIFWTISGEKNMMGGRTIGQPLGWLEIDGAYTLSNKNKIAGAITSSFKKSNQIG